ncbi:MAG: hypothetical protein KGZ59_02980 [Chitinophagaceae bacterium]|nr:hypothetical protein [Chitinophagaceae bacterium]
MKKSILTTIAILSSSIIFSQINILTKDTTKPVQVVETACGQCQLGLPGKSCDLAVRINGKAYFVTGTSIDDHGDAHANDGFCNKIRKAEVQGEIKDEKFLVSYFKLIQEKKADK